MSHEAPVSGPARAEFDPPLEYTSPLKRFLHHDVMGSAILLAAAAAALVLANTGLKDAYHHFWEIEFGFSIGEFVLIKPLHLWVNDGLMAVFFFLVGLEIKRELLAGELASLDRAMLPVAAAMGGMAAPALIYAAVNAGGDALHGWGIPMATDIAFAAGCIAIMKKRVPPALMVFLVALAIVDDLGAVTVIALFYTDKIDPLPLFTGGGLIATSAALSWLGVRNVLPYIAIGVVVWVAFLNSGVHATIAGVLLAFTIPSDARYQSRLFAGRVGELLSRFGAAETDRRKESGESAEKPGRLLVSARQQDLIRAMTTECHHVEAPLQRIEYNIEPFCVFIIMPVFAFANSGLTIDFDTILDTLTQRVTLGVFLGLVVGKQAGILAASWLAVKLRLASLPRGVLWKQLYAVSWLAAIGFTMSLFIAELAFDETGETAEMHLMQAKAAVFIASISAGVIGLLLLRIVCPLQPEPVGQK